MGSRSVAFDSRTEICANALAKARVSARDVGRRTVLLLQHARECGAVLTETLLQACRSARFQHAPLTLIHGLISLPARVLVFHDLCEVMG